MRVPGIFALCLAGALSLTATGQSTPATAGQSVQSKNSSALPVTHSTPKASPQTAEQPGGSAHSTQPQKPEMKLDWPPLSLPAQKSQAQKTLQLNQQMLNSADQNAQAQRRLPQAPFDRGIYLGRNSFAADHTCLAIQSYNFSQGESPKLESITTCTTVRQPLMRNARKPANSDQQGQGNQDQENQEPNKDPK